MVGVAVKVTVTPAQAVVAEAPIDTLTGRFGFTVTVYVAVAFAHGLLDTVMVKVTVVPPSAAAAL